MKILGVDIGSFSIKIAELETTGRGFAFDGFYEFPLSVDPGRDRAIEIIEILRSVAARYDASSTKWVIGVPQHRVSVHHRRFPFRERQKILKSLAFELEDDIPLDIDETIFDLKVVEFVGQMADTLTVASPREAVQQSLNVARDGGIDPDIVSVEGLAYSNVFERWNSAPPEVPPSARVFDETTGVGPHALTSSRLVLHLGHQRSLLLVYRDGALIATRTMLWGGAEIAEALGRTFGVTIFEAVKILQEKSFILMNSAGASRDQQRLSQTVTDCVDNLIRQLRLILLELKADFGLEFTSIDLTGGVSQIQNLGPYLTQGLEIPANTAANAFDDKHPRFGLTPQIEAVAGPALGLAIEGMKRPRNPPLNLRKGELARENLTMKVFWEEWRLPVQIAVAAFAIFFVYSIVRDQVASGLLSTADERLVEAAGKTAGLRGGSANESGINRYIRQQKTLIKSREALAQIDNYSSALDVLNKVSEKLPVVSKPTPGKGIDVTYFNVDGDEVRIEGRAQGIDLAQIERALSEVAQPRKVEKAPETATGTGPGTPFSYKFKVLRKL